jgi:Mg2+/Co2+ transporter CorC
VFSGYLKEFYTRCVVVQMKKVHDDGKTLELASMLKLLGYEGFSVLALAEVKELAEAMGWKFTGNRVDSVGGFFQVFFFPFLRRYNLKGFKF